MKKIKYLITCFIAVFILAGCNGMDNEPTNSYTNKSFWTSIDKAQYMLNMAYNQLYSAGKMWQDEALSDNVPKDVDSLTNEPFAMVSLTQPHPSLPTSGVISMEVSRPLMSSWKTSIIWMHRKL